MPDASTFSAMNTLTATIPTQTEYPDFAPARPVAKAKAKWLLLPWGKILAGVAIITIAATGIGGYVYYAAGFESTDDAFLAGDVHPVSPRINGTVAKVLVDDNAHVEAGQPLVEIDPADLNLAMQGGEADLAQARANAAEVTAQIARAQADIETAAARIAQNAAQLKLAELDFHRMEQLVKTGAASTQALDEARATFEAAQATQQSLDSAHTAAAAGLASAQAQRAVALALVQKAEAALSTAKLQVDYTIIRAPSTGRIAKKTVEVGERLQPGQPVMAVVDDQVWVVANFKENQLAHLRPGEKVTVKVDAIDGQAFQGIVDSFSPGTGAQFSLLPPDNATGNFTKIVQRVPVKIRFAHESLAASASRLSPGLSAVVEVSVRE
jgi:membrane fusion protein (multidrug efflux system)